MQAADGPQVFLHYLIWPPFKKVWTPLMYDKEKHQSLRFNKHEPKNAWLFCFKTITILKKLFNSQNNCNKFHILLNN